LIFTYLHKNIITVDVDYEGSVYHITVIAEDVNGEQEVFCGDSIL